MQQNSNSDHPNITHICILSFFFKVFDSILKHSLYTGIPGAQTLFAVIFSVFLEGVGTTKGLSTFLHTMPEK